MCMLLPLPRHSDWRSCFALTSSRVSLPRNGCRVGLRIVCFEACSAFTQITACTLALSPYFVTRLTEGFNHFVTSLVAPVASGWSISPGGVRTHWKAPPLHGARRKCEFAFLVTERPNRKRRSLRHEAGSARFGRQAESHGRMANAGLISDSCLS